MKKYAWFMKFGAWALHEVDSAGTPQGSHVIDLRYDDGLEMWRWYVSMKTGFPEAGCIFNAFADVSLKPATAMARAVEHAIGLGSLPRDPDIAVEVR